jgi:hypothetical protein
MLAHLLQAVWMYARSLDVFIVDVHSITCLGGRAQNILQHSRTVNVLCQVHTCAWCSNLVVIHVQVTEWQIMRPIQAAHMGPVAHTTEIAVGFATHV